MSEAQAPIPPLPAPGTDWHAWIRWGIAVVLAAAFTFLGNAKLDEAKQEVKQEVKALKSVK